MQMLFHVLQSLFHILCQILPVTFVALFGVELMTRLGVMRKLEPLGAPLARASRLPAVSSVTFVASIGSVIAANTMLASYRNDGLIDDRELVLSSLLNSVPMYLRELLTYHFPVIFPLLGVRVGMIYFMTFWLSGFIKIVFIIVGGRFLLGRRNEAETTEPKQTHAAPADASKSRSIKKLLSDTLRSRMKIFLRISGYYAVVTFFLLLFMDLGFFKWTDSLIGPLIHRFGLPSVVIGPLSAYVISPMVGLASVSTLLQTELITERQAILALLLGGFLMIPMIYMRSMLPSYVALFGARLGAVIVSLSVGFTLLARVAMLTAVMAGFPE